MASRLAPAATAIVAVTLAAAQGSAADSAVRECAGREAVPSQIRPIDCPFVALLTDGLQRSATLRGLVDRIGELKGIVYINEGHYTRRRTGRALTGALSHYVSMAGAHTILRVTLALERGDGPIATLAHELQHVVEVLEAGARTEASVNALFDRIGMQAYNGVVETKAAIDVQRTVEKELTESRRLTRRR